MQVARLIFASRRRGVPVLRLEDESGENLCVQASVVLLYHIMSYDIMQFIVHEVLCSACYVLRSKDYLFCIMLCLILYTWCMMH